MQARAANWRTGSRGSQAYVMALLVLGVAACFVAAWNTSIVPFSVWFVWLLLGVLALRFYPLLLLSVVVLAAGVGSTLREQATEGPRVTAVVMLALSQILVLLLSSRQKSGLPVTLSELMLANLRDRLQAQGSIPPLPEGWTAQSQLLAAHGVGYAGDFVIADLSDGRHLELVLVDVMGKGVAVGPQALQFSGALGGLISGDLPPVELLRAANRFLLRQESEEAFATAVHLVLDLRTGDYVITSAGHPPALHWNAYPGGWRVNNSTGTALGVIDDPDLCPSIGRLAPGEALMFYTDGVIEARGRDLDEGVEWLREIALRAVHVEGFPGAARRILRHVPRGQDDRAVLILERRPTWA